MVWVVAIVSRTVSAHDGIQTVDCVLEKIVHCRLLGGLRIVAHEAQHRVVNSRRVFRHVTLHRQRWTGRSRVDRAMIQSETLVIRRDDACQCDCRCRWFVAGQQVPADVVDRVEGLRRADVGRTKHARSVVRWGAGQHGQHDRSPHPRRADTFATDDVDYDGYVKFAMDLGGFGAYVGYAVPSEE